MSKFIHSPSFPSQVAVPKKDQTVSRLSRLPRSADEIRAILIKAHEANEASISTKDSKIGSPTESAHSGAMKTGFGDTNPLFSRSQPDASVQTSPQEFKCFLCEVSAGSKSELIAHGFEAHVDEICKESNAHAQKTPDKRSRQNPQGKSLLDRPDLLDRETSMSAYVFDPNDIETNSLRGLESDARFLEKMARDQLAKIKDETVPGVENLIDRYRACRWDDYEQKDKMNTEFKDFIEECYRDDTPYHQDAAVLEAALRAEYGTNISQVLPLSDKNGSAFIAVCLESDCEIPPKTKYGFDVKKGLLHHLCGGVPGNARKKGHARKGHKKSGKKEKKKKNSERKKIMEEERKIKKAEKRKGKHKKRKNCDQERDSDDERSSEQSTKKSTKYR